VKDLELAHRDDAVERAVVAAVDRVVIPATPPLRLRRRRPVALVAVGAIAMVGMMVFALWPRPEQDRAAAPGLLPSRVAVVSDNERRLTGRIDIVDLATGQSVATLPTDYHPDFAADNRASAIYLMSTATANFYLGTSTLRALDARTLAERWHITVEDRLQYPILGPSTLAVSPDARRLVIAHYQQLGPDRANYWVTAHDTQQGAAVGRINLPGCGGMHLNFSSDGAYLLVTCSRSSDVRFVSTKSWSLDATVVLPRQSAPGFEAVASTAILPGRLLVMLRDLRIALIDTSTHALSINEKWKVGSAVVWPDNLATSSDGQRLWVPLQTGTIASLNLANGERNDTLESDVRAITVVNDQLLVAGAQIARFPSGPGLGLPVDEGWSIWRLVPIP
jgi:hypothetical protein